MRTPGTSFCSANTIVTGYGFTAEPDYLYALDRATGQVKGRLLLPSAPERIARHGNVLTVDTYDHRVVVRVTRRLMLGVGDRIPDATVWVGPRERHTIAEIVEDGPVLLLFYLFDWTST